jgi:TolB-like protein
MFSSPLAIPRYKLAISRCFAILALSIFCTPSLVAAERPLVAVTPMQARGVSESDAAVLTENIADEFLKSGTVRVMERSQMDQILKEQGFQESGACDTSECAVEIGKLLGISQIVVGTVGKVGETYSLSVRMVDVATGEVRASSRLNHRGAIDEVLQKVVPKVVQELTRKGKRKNAEPVATPSVESGRSSKVLWWTLGGAAVVGGAAAVLLLAGEDPATTPPPAGPGSDADLFDVTVEAP